MCSRLVSRSFYEQANGAGTPMCFPPVRTRSRSCSCVPGAGEGRSTDWHCHGNASPHAAQLIRVRGPRGPGAHASVALSPSRRLINLPGLLRARAGERARVYKRRHPPPLLPPSSVYTLLLPRTLPLLSLQAADSRHPGGITSTVTEPRAPFPWRTR